MRFSVLEQFSCGKALSGYTEDRIVATEHHFGVLDGSRGPGYPSADVITAILDEAQALFETIPDDITLDALIDAFNAITRKHKQAAQLEDYRHTGGFVFCLYSRHAGEIWRVGDCKFRNAGIDHANFWETEEVCARARSMIIHAKLQSGMSVEDVMADPGYDHLIDDLLHYEASFLCRAMNPRSIGAIIGLAVPKEQQQCFKAKAGRLVITSDGYPQLLDDLEKTEAALKEILLRDPLCIDENLQCKGMGAGRLSFDDRSFIAAQLHP